MADPLPYNAYSQSGAQTREQLVADLATSLMLEFMNADGSFATSPLLAADAWAAAGIPLPPAYLMGSAAGGTGGVADPQVYQLMTQMASYAVDHPGFQGTQFPQLPAGGPVLSQNDQNNAANKAAQDSVNATSIANQTASDIASGQRNDSNIAANKDIATLEATVDREGFASNERIAQLGRESTERIAGQTESGLNRRFDLQLEEDRRTFNADFLFKLLDRGAELAKMPVDWIAHAYYMDNIGIPVTALNLSSMATMLGALPPSGPSSVGPLTGGPASIDGDMAAGQAVGVAQPGPVSVGEAVQFNPGNSQAVPWSPGVATMNTGASVQKWQSEGINLDQIEGHLQQMRETTLPSIIKNPNLANQLAGLRAGNTSLIKPPANWGGAGRGIFNRDQIPPVPGQPAQQQQQQTPGLQGVGMAAPAAPPVPQGTQVAFGKQGVGMAAPPPVPGAPNPQTKVQTSMINQQAPAVGQATDQANAINQHLGQLVPGANYPTGMMGGTAPVGAAGIANNPWFKAVNDPSGATQPGYYRTATDPSKFQTVQAYGVPVNFRSGQDINAGTYLKALPSAREGMDAVINSTGQYLPDVQAQMLRSSPTTNYDPGFFGRRRV